MRIVWMFAAAFVLSACSTLQDDVRLPPPPADPVAYVQRFIMEQPEPRPQGVHATAEYVEYVEYVEHSGNGCGNTARNSRACNVAFAPEVTRIYYSSIGRNSLYRRDDASSMIGGQPEWYVSTFNKQGSLLAEIWSDDRDAALRYMAALEELRRRAGN